MMKKILFTLTILLFATGSSMAQEITNPELKKFVAELRTPGNGPRNVSKDEEKGIYAINSVDEESYKALSAIIEKYDIYFAEEIFGMELMLNVREGGSQTIVFQGDTYGLAITDNVHSFDLAIIIVKGSAIKLYFNIEGAKANTQEVHFSESGGDVYIGSRSAGVEETVALTDVPEIEKVERPLPSDIALELFDHYMPMIQELETKNSAGADSIRQVWKDEILYLESWIKRIESPGMIKIPCTGNFMIVIPEGTKQGLYEWINSTGACRTQGQKIAFILASDIAVYSAASAKQPHHTAWSLEGYSDAMKELFVKEVPGGEPVYIYRRSTTTEGYETMKNDLRQFFYLDGNDKSHRYKGFNTIERIDTEEYCFLHLYDGTTTILIYDSRAEKYCQMDIIVGGAEVFYQAVNDISIEGDNAHAAKCNVIICDGGVEFVDGEVEINGVTYDSGVHFTTGYMEKLK